HRPTTSYSRLIRVSCSEMILRTNKREFISENLHLAAGHRKVGGGNVSCRQRPAPWPPELFSESCAISTGPRARRTPPSEPTGSCSSGLRYTTIRPLLRR